MERNTTILRIWPLILGFLWTTHTFAQQISPIDLILKPHEYQGGLSGTGGGDANSLKLQSASPSAQGLLELDLGLHETKRKAHKVVYPVIVRWNFLPASKVVGRDTFNSRSIAFVDNNQLFNFGLRMRNLSADPNQSGEYFLHSTALDFSMNSYAFSDSLGDLAFDSFNFLISEQLAAILDSRSGPIGIFLSPSASFVTISDRNPQALERVLKFSSSPARSFVGVGGKVQVQINDIAIFFEVKQFFPTDGKTPLPSFSDKPIISFGGNALGSVLKFKR